MPEKQWEPWYRALKDKHPDAYRKAIHYSEGIALNRDLSIGLAAEIEVSHVMLACECLGVKP